MFTIDGLVVKFYHDDYINRKRTTCIIKDKDTDKGVAWGMSLCSEKDNFSRKIGRKIALTRALENFDKNFRTKVWSKYFEISKK